MANAAQFTLVDDTLSWIRSGFEYATQLGPTNWTSPTNYSVGSRLYLRHEILNKPSTMQVGVQLCFRQNGKVNETCSHIFLTDTVGVYYQDLGTINGWWLAQPINFTIAFDIVFIHKPNDGTNHELNAYAYPSIIDQHVPIKFHATVIVVSAGSTLEAPATWKGNPWANVAVQTPNASHKGNHSVLQNVSVRRCDVLLCLGTAGSNAGSVQILDATGALVKSLSSVGMTGGTVVWDKTNQYGSMVKPGMYIAVVRRGAATASAKIILAQ